MKNLIILIAIAILFIGVDTIAKDKKNKIKVDPEIEQFLIEFKDAVKAIDKERISSFVEYPYFRYDYATLSDEKFSKNEFFKIDESIYYYGAGLTLIDSKSKDRKKLLKSKNIKHFKPEYDSFYDTFPKLKNKEIIELSLNNKSYGLKCFLFQKINSVYKLIGEIVESGE